MVPVMSIYLESASRSVHGLGRVSIFTHFVTLPDIPLKLEGKVHTCVNLTYRSRTCRIFQKNYNSWTLLQVNEITVVVFKYIFWVRKICREIISCEKFFLHRGKV